MHNDFVHADDGFAHLAREHPEAQIDMAFLMRIIPCVCSSSCFPVRALGPAVGTSLSSGRFHRWSEPGGFVVSSSFATVPQPAEETDRVTQSIRGGSESGATLLGKRRTVPHLLGKGGRLAQKSGIDRAGLRPFPG